MKNRINGEPEQQNVNNKLSLLRHNRRRPRRAIDSSKKPPLCRLRHGGRKLPVSAITRRYQRLQPEHSRDEVRAYDWASFTSGCHKTCPAPHRFVHVSRPSRYDGREIFSKIADRVSVPSFNYYSVSVSRPRSFATSMKLRRLSPAPAAIS